MSNPEHEDRLLLAIRTGDGPWNRWRAEQIGLRPDLRDLLLPRTGEGLSILGWDISGFNFREADLRGANLYRSWLVGWGRHTRARKARRRKLDGSAIPPRQF